MTRQQSLIKLTGQMGGVSFYKTAVVNTSESATSILNSQNQPAINLANAVTPNSVHPLFLAFGIEFYQQVNRQMCSLKNGAYNALSLVEVNGGN